MNTQAPYVIDIMSPSLVAIGPEMPTWSAECLRKERGVHYLLVIDGYRLVGLVCGCDLHRAGAAAHVSACMQTAPSTIDDQERADRAVERMTRTGVGCLPVVDWSGALRGVITRHDLRDVGLLPRDGIRVCTACGSTHGLTLSSGDPEDDECPLFCLRCREQSSRPKTSIDDAYYTLGGGD